MGAYIMIKINMDMPKNCKTCHMMDEDFIYCHAKKDINAWECWNKLDNGEDARPSWCPLIEDNESEGNN